MTTEQSSYRQIFKATSIFGGVQVFNIIITIIRTKIVAVLLGPAGMGVNGLLTATTGMVTSLTGFGLGTSAVKNVAAAHATGDTIRIATVVGVMRKAVWITGLLGALVTLILSPWLSELTFQNRDYTLAFAWVSVSLLFNQIASGENVLLQGTRQLKYMAQASLAGSVMGLLVSVPIYYRWGIDGIVPAIIVSSVVALVISRFFSRKVKTLNVAVNRKTFVNESKGMFAMGFMLSLNGIITLAVSYIVKIFISNIGGVEQVGLYTAGFAIINTYVGMIFTAMSADYYPRLSGVAHDNKKASELINQQGEMAILIMGPVLTVFIIFIQYVIIILYSPEFTAVNGMVQWAALGMLFRAASWAIAFIMLAKGASRLFFWNELVANAYVLGLNILGYHLAGLTGLGISFLAAYLLYFAQVFFLTKHKFGFFLQPGYVKIFSLHLLLCIASFLIIRFVPAPMAYFAGVIIAALAAAISIRGLDKRLNIKTFYSKQK